MLDPYKRKRISTFDPSRLQKSDFLDISFYKRFTLRLQSASAASAPFKFHYTSSGYEKRNPFPIGSNGFFYYHLPKGLSPLAGDIRFRKTTISEPGSFANGVDLLLPDGLPWSYPLHQLVEQPLLSRILVDDGVVTSDAIEHCREVFKGRGKKFNWGTPLLFHLSQPFSIRLDKSYVRLWVVVKDQLLGPTIVSTDNIISEFAQAKNDDGSTGHAHVRLVQSEYGQLRAQLLAVQHAANTPPFGHSFQTAYNH
ncbi:hypothetical protein BT96DRAFT_936617 [Gymnopus androsaceus JB14]|uniref:Uncharacterized protein n=1 Tax=Gymnopus androsaceus JB14 TaxID=1447944 RepID=A0A6A4I1G7_9AGAR|nr:hypothetical protein BT96DRAFT_936617 [Gymnopus androsaceus JB14]